MIRSLFLALAVVLYTLAAALSIICIARWWPRAAAAISLLYFRMILITAFGVRVEVRGREHLAEGRNYIFMANHQSALDIPVLYSNLPFRPRFLAKKELGEIPIFGWAMHALGHVMIDRKDMIQAKGTLETAVRRMQLEKLSLITFPEGTRTLDGNVGTLKKGVFLLAIQSGIPVVPVSIDGAYEVFPKKRLTYCPGTVTMTIHSPMDVSGYTVETKEILMEKVKSCIVSGVRTHGPAQPITKS